MGAATWGHGLTAREQAIVDRDEAGIDPADIAAELGLAERYVRQILKSYSGSWKANNDFEAMVRAGSRLLATATSRVGRFT